MKEKSFAFPIALISVTIPALVFFLFYLKPPQIHIQADLSVLPLLNASLNFTASILLLLGLYFIKTKRIIYHRYTMLTAFTLSVLFLISYVIYHTLSEPTHFGGTGIIRSVYFFILISHITLSVVIVPLVLITLSRALQSRFDRHRRIARWTWPLWFYVTVTGVLVYIMLSPYYR